MSVMAKHWKNLLGGSAAFLFCASGLFAADIRFDDVEAPSTERPVVIRMDDGLDDEAPVVDESAPDEIGDTETTDAAEGETSTAEAGSVDEQWNEYCNGGYTMGYNYGGGREVWAKVDAIGWWTKTMSVPPLVTTGTPQSQGVLGREGTRILYGGDSIFDDWRWGGRLTFGLWTSPCRNFGLEGEFFMLENASSHFYAESDGTTVLARPFYNVGDPDHVPPIPPQQDSQLARGYIDVRGSSELTSAGVRARYNLCCIGPCSCDDVCGRQTRVDLIGGYRFMKLKEGLVIDELRSDGVEPNVTEFAITDWFDAGSEFHGGEIGLLYQRTQGRFTLEVLGKVALGNSHDRVRIYGHTDLTFQGTTTPYNAGILALQSNIGDRDQDEFAVIPEVGITLGYCLNDHWTASLGYTFIYWSHVVRPGDQIDNRLDVRQFPPPSTTTAVYPAFSFQATDYWAQGLNFGLEYTW